MITGDSREYPARPWVGVGVVVWRDGRVLLVRRGRAPRRGEWSIPGGAQRLGETVAEAAVREIAEETGLTVQVGRVISVEDAITRDADGRVHYHYTLIELAAEWLAGEAVAADDADEVGWFTLEEAEAVLVHAKTWAVVRRAADLLHGVSAPAPGLLMSALE